MYAAVLSKLPPPRNYAKTYVPRYAYERSIERETERIAVCGRKSTSSNSNPKSDARGHVYAFQASPNRKLRSIVLYLAEFYSGRASGRAVAGDDLIFPYYLFFRSHPGIIEYEASEVVRARSSLFIPREKERERERWWKRKLAAPGMTKSLRVSLALMHTRRFRTLPLVLARRRSSFFFTALRLWIIDGTRYTHAGMRGSCVSAWIRNWIMIARDAILIAFTWKIIQDSKWCIPSRVEPRGK